MSDNILKEIEKNIVIKDTPSEYMESIKEDLKSSNLKDLFDLREIEQEKEHHPEGNVWNHTMQVLDQASKIKEFANDKDVLMISALFHDIGKKRATRKNKKGRIIAYDHDKYGAEMMKKILNEYNFPENKINKIVNLVRYHMHHLYIIKNLPYGNTELMIRDVDINDIILLFIADRLGRNNEDEASEVINDVQYILDKLEKQYDIDIEKIKYNTEEIRKMYLIS